MTDIPHPKPWAEDGYLAADQKILVLGISHHGTPEEASGEQFEQLTKEVVRARVEGHHAHFFPMVEWVLSKTPDDLSTQSPGDRQARKSFWQKTAFANYITEMLPEAGSGSEAQKDASLPRIEALLRALTPDIVFVFGTKVFDHFAKHAAIKITEPPEIDGLPTFVWQPSPDDKAVIISRLDHPRALSTTHAVWRERAQQLIKRQAGR